MRGDMRTFARSLPTLPTTSMTTCWHGWGWRSQRDFDPSEFEVEQANRALTTVIPSGPDRHDPPSPEQRSTRRRVLASPCSRPVSATADLGVAPGQPNRRALN